ncbi:hypothetical protein NBRC3257_0503 [Gluconobacter thailandicus NBRC 3257]|uniref:Uncharacterized protein n=1 Tax=Gluconobacter thailandicus NBRC 3257 TaxID=1381097 RepID=A0ABQ0ITG6_GLUTH|nr:hypothetical protein B932_1996 [Gluconobacter oxydans H24]GAC87536.1 hypothetical protein NBRC3255_1197 [Gluconobacter thailandicus NBRC 3255]GAD25504.1 hypothetical protein NBRC3257_0503 [Gluconobacter thailandicus NBRC 3257]
MKTSLFSSGEKGREGKYADSESSLLRIGAFLAETLDSTRNPS